MPADKPEKPSKPLKLAPLDPPDPLEPGPSPPTPHVPGKSVPFELEPSSATPPAPPTSASRPVSASSPAAPAGPTLSLGESLGPLLGPAQGPKITKGFLCPKDGTPMTKFKAVGHLIDRCPTCGAMWFDATDLKISQRHHSMDSEVAAGARRAASGQSSDLACPRDGTRLVEVRFSDQSHILVLQCSVCGGRLLDTGELTDQIDYTLAERIKSFFA